MRPWQALSDLNDRTSLRGKLITALLALVAVGLVAISVAGVMVLRSYLVSQDDPQLQQVFSYEKSVINSGIGFSIGTVTPVHGTNFIWGVQQQGTPLSMSGSGSRAPATGVGPGRPHQLDLGRREQRKAPDGSGAVRQRQLAGHHGADSVH